MGLQSFMGAPVAVEKLSDTLAALGIEDLQGRVVLTRTDIDERLESYLTSSGIPVSAPDRFLRTAIFQQDCFTIGLQDAAAGQDTTLDIHRQLDISFQSLHHVIDLLLCSR